MLWFGWLKWKALQRELDRRNGEVKIVLGDKVTQNLLEPQLDVDHCQDWNRLQMVDETHHV